MLTLQDIQICLQIAVFAVVFSNILTQKSNVFAHYGRFLNWLEARAPWLAYLLGYCEKCLAGQISMWGFLAHYGANALEDWPRWISFVSTSILAAATIALLFARLRR